MDMFELKNAGIDTEYPYKKQYGNYIGGQWVAPLSGDYFDNISQEDRSAIPILSKLPIIGSLF